MATACKYHLRKWWWTWLSTGSVTRRFPGECREEYRFQRFEPRRLRWNFRRPDPPILFGRIRIQEALGKRKKIARPDPVSPEPFHPDYDDSAPNELAVVYDRKRGGEQFVGKNTRILWDFLEAQQEAESGQA